MNFFTPGTADLNRLYGAALDAAEDGMDPLCMLDHMGIPYHVMLPDGRDHEVMPWPEIEGYLVVANAEYAVHWMHPLLRAPRLPDRRRDLRNGDALRTEVPSFP